MHSHTHHHSHRSSHRFARGARDTQKGMTLLEIMIVVAILGMLATVVVTNLMGSLDNAKINTTKTKISGVESAIKQYYLDQGDYPNSMRDLMNPGGGMRPYVKNEPLDAWNKPMIYKRTSGGDEPFVVYSMGPDMAKGTPDDVYAKGAKRK